MNNFTKRTITGLSLAFLVILSLLVSTWLFAMLFLLVTILGLNEFFTLVTTESAKPQKVMGMTAGAVWFLSYAWVSLGPVQLLNFFETGIGFYLLFLPSPVFLYCAHCGDIPKATESHTECGLYMVRPALYTVAP